MWKRDRRPRQGDRRTVALAESGLVNHEQWRAVLDPKTVCWALEEFDGRLWHLQGVSDEPSGAARFMLGNRLSRR